MYKRLMESKKDIDSFLKTSPRIGLILGSGLGGLVDKINKPRYLNYQDITGFPQVTVEGHQGQLIEGTIKGVPILAFKGRFHYYEGYTMKEVAYPVYMMKLLGLDTLLVTNACGGINLELEPGDLMLLDDFINLMPDNPLIGKNLDDLGPRFPDMTDPYDSQLRDLARRTADSLSIDYKEGVYASFMGPYYETRAEIRAIQAMGADAVGMSTVPETIVANHLGIKTLGISVITNMATGIQKKKHSHASVVAMAEAASINLVKWVEHLLPALNLRT